MKTIDRDRAIERKPGGRLKIERGGHREGG